MPARVFQAMVALINAFEDFDQQLARLAAPKLQPVLLLEDIETGSLRTWLTTSLVSMDDDVLKSGEWKKALGCYLVKAKYAAIDFLNGRTTIGSKEEIEDLQRQLTAAAEESSVLPIPAYTPVPAPVIANTLRVLSVGVSNLRPEDHPKIITADGERPLNVSFHLAPDTIEELLTRETIPNTLTLILKVKKPDFLGESKWEFRHEGKTIEAKMLDTVWLSKFRTGEIRLVPGDALRARLRIEAKYGFDGEVIATDCAVLEVLGIVSTLPAQEGLLGLLPPPNGDEETAGD